MKTPTPLPGAAVSVWFVSTSTSVGAAPLLDAPPEGAVPDVPPLDVGLLLRAKHPTRTPAPAAATTDVRPRVQARAIESAFVLTAFLPFRRAAAQRCPPPRPPPE